MDKALRQRLKSAYNALEDRPLEPDDPYYVPFRQRASDDPIADLGTAIAFAPSSSVHLVSGQRGNGKSTELRRLRRLLQDDEDADVYLCDMRDYMNLTTSVEITDFLIATLGAWSDAIEEKHGLQPGKEGYWPRALKLLTSDIHITELKAEAGSGDAKLALGLALKQDPSFRRQLQLGLRGHVARLVKDAQEFVAETVEQLRAFHQDPDKKIVLIVDSVEQIRGSGPDAEDIHRSVERLFTGNTEWLRFDLLHVVYTIPPYLPPLSPGLGARLGDGTICNLPSVHVRLRDGGEDPEGLKVMQQIVERRINNWRDFFTEEQLRDATLNTGGDLRNFLLLLRKALIKASHGDGLRVDDSALLRVTDDLRRDMLPIATDDAEWLRRIHHSKRPELPNTAELPRLARFFDTTLVLNYRNGDDWYDIHPLLQAVLMPADQ